MTEAVGLGALSLRPAGKGQAGSGASPSGRPGLRQCGLSAAGGGRTPCRKFAEEFTLFLQIFMLSAEKNM